MACLRTDKESSVSAGIWYVERLAISRPHLHAAMAASGPSVQLSSAPTSSRMTRAEDPLVALLLQSSPWSS